MRIIVSLVLTGLVLVGPSTYANEKKNPFYNGTIKIVGMNEASFAQAVNKYEMDGKMQLSSSKELKQLFSCFDTNKSGVIEADEFDGVAAKAKKKKKGGSGGGSTCEFSTCDCDTLGGGSIVTPGGTTPRETTGSEGGSGARSGTWCGARCHCHCNTHSCAPDGA